MNFLPELSPGGGHGNNFTAIVVFSRLAFAYPASKPTAVNLAKVFIGILIRYGYLPTLLTNDKGSIFVLVVTHEKAEVVRITLHNATTKHAQTIGVFKKTHATIKTLSKMSLGELANEGTNIYR